MPNFLQISPTERFYEQKLECDDKFLRGKKKTKRKKKKKKGLIFLRINFS